MSARFRYTGLLLAAVLLASLLANGNASAQAQSDPVAAAPVAAAQNGAQGPTVVGSDSPLVSTVPETLPWGVVEMGDWTHISTNLRVPVYDIQQIGNRVFVAGSFGKIQKGPGGRQVDQSFVAAFDLATGNLIEDWRPTVNATVYALAATDDGKLIIGGDFTQVNGQPHTAAMAALNALTGDLAAGFRSGLERPWSANEPVVRDLEVHGAYIYAAGNFSHQVSLASRTRVYKAMRVSQVNGNLDTSWVPHVTGAGLWSMSVSPDGSRITLGGFQTASTRSRTPSGSVLFQAQPATP